MKLGWIFLITGIFATSMAPFSINNASATGTLYGLAYSTSDGPADFYSIDPSTGDGTFIGSTGFERCSGMDFLLDTLYATCERTDGSDTAVLVTINISTGDGTEVAELNGGSTHSFGDAYSDISFRNSDGALYAYLEAGDGVGTIDITNGDLTELGASNSNSCCGNGIAFDLGDTLFHATDFPLNTLDQTSGAATLVTNLNYPDPPHDDDPRINAMDLDPWTGVMYGSCNEGSGGQPENYLCTVDVTNGDVTTIGQTVDGLDAIAFVNEAAVIGGELLPINNISLMLAGIQFGAFWIIPAIVASAGLSAFIIKIRKN